MKLGISEVKLPKYLLNPLFKYLQINIIIIWLLICNNQSKNNINIKWFKINEEYKWIL